MGEVVVAPSADFAQRAAGWIAERMVKACAERGRCSLALSGGSTPRPVYAELVRRSWSTFFPWRNAFVYFADERAVPPNHPESNYRMAREALLDHVDVEPAHIHRMEADGPDVDAAATRYAQLLPDPLDILILGMGGDGHTASLFPRSPVLQEKQRRVVAVTDSPKPPPLRLTITPPVIAAAREVVVLVTGADKAEVVARALEGDLDIDTAPIQLARHGTWILDEPAASALTRVGR